MLRAIRLPRGWNVGPTFKAWLVVVVGTGESARFDMTNVSGNHDRTELRGPLGEIASGDGEDRESVAVDLILEG